jgi:glycolate oxidase iron-sulfur subunit
MMATAPETGSRIAALQREDSTTSRAVRDVVEYELLFDCVHCGLCLEACPTYVVTRAEMDSPRGRIYLMKALAEGQLELDRDAVRHLDLCLGCRGCETACPSGVRYGRLIEHARNYVERNWQRSISERVRNRLISAIFPYPRRLRTLLAPLRFAERVGLGKLLRSLSPRSIRDWLDLLPALNLDQTIPAYPDSTVAGKNAPESAIVSSVVVHHGCVAQVLNESTNLNCERALGAAGYSVVGLGKTVCCGALDIHHGHLERARQFARTNVAELAASGAASIISAASGCAAVIAQYGQLLKDDPVFATQARDISARVTDLSSLLMARPGSEPIFPPSAPRGVEGRQDSRSVTEFRATVTYHDSCHLAHGLGVREQPRQLVRSIPGVRLIELPESDLCCGSAGSYNLTERAMARELARRKVDNIVSTGADFVLLSNPGCEFQIAAELKRRASSVRVLHVADFLALAATAGSTTEWPCMRQAPKP